MLCLFVGLVLSSSQLEIQVSQTGEFHINVGGGLWFENGRIALNADGWSSTDDGTLKMIGVPSVAKGSDQLGAFNSTTIQFTTTTTPFTVIIRDYTVSGIPAIIFEQYFPNGAEKTQTSANVTAAAESVLSVFPSIAVNDDGIARGYFTYFDQMIGGVATGTRFGKLTPDTRDIPGGSKAGPLVIFDSDMSNVVVFSSWSSFMVGNLIQNPSTGHIEMGMIGSVSFIPAGFSYSTVLFAGSGVSNTVRAFGHALRHYYGKVKIPSDLTLQTLGYSTDNGAYYYYNTPNNATFESELLALANFTRTKNIPVNYILLDSWWYYKGPTGGVSQWEARPDAFPNGLQNFRRQSRWPIQGHNRYWDKSAVYAKQNGGNYNFILEGNYSIPNDPAFWEYLLEEGQSWGLIVYEQDWLHNEWELMNVTRQSATLARDWLTQMGQAAAKLNITIQYCMAYPRFALFSVELSAVNQVRASDDYLVDLVMRYPKPANLFIGVSSLFAHALGLRPSKDVFWTTPVEPGSEFGDVTAHWPDVHALVATYSTGPVAFGDAIFAINASMLSRSCMSNGTLLQPSAPFVAVDEYYRYRALGDKGPQGEVWTSFSRVGSVVWYHLLALDLSSDYVISASTLNTSEAIIKDGTPFVWYSQRSNWTFSTPQPFSTLTVAAVELPEYTLIHLAPIFHNGWVLLGEESKWVPVSNRRIRSISASSTHLNVLVGGVAGESVALSFKHTTGTTLTVKCVVPKGTFVTISSDSTCK